MAVESGLVFIWALADAVSNLFAPFIWARSHLKLFEALVVSSIALPAPLFLRRPSLATLHVVVVSRCDFERVLLS